MVCSQLRCELLQPALRGDLRPAAVGVPHHLGDTRMQLLGEVTEYISLLVNLTALHETPVPEAFSNCCPERLAPIDDEEVALMCIEPTLDQVVEQLAADCGILGGAQPDSERVFCAAFVEPQGNYNRMLIDLDAIEHNGHQTHVGHVAVTPRFEAF